MALHQFPVPRLCLAGAELLTLDMLSCHTSQLLTVIQYHCGRKVFLIASTSNGLVAVRVC